MDYKFLYKYRSEVLDMILFFITVIRRKGDWISYIIYDIDKININKLFK